MLEHEDFSKGGKKSDKKQVNFLNKSEIKPV